MNDLSCHPDPADRLLAATREDDAPCSGPEVQLQPVLDRLIVLLERVLAPDASATARADAPIPSGETAWHEPGLSESVVQQLRLCTPRSGPDVSYRIVDGQVQTLDPGILLTEGARISFDTYLNSFYEHYWSSHAPVGDLTLRLFGTGEVLVEFFRSLPDGSSYPLGRRRIRLAPQHGATASVALDPSPAGAGRIFFEARAMARTVIRAGRLETSTAPRHEVRLGIAICTFNREAALAANLRRLLASPYQTWASPRIVVVNQGKTLSSEAMVTLLASEHGRCIEAVEQANLGGTGGFTRAVVEILRGGLCSHVLFMDDDVELDPAVLITTHAFAARATAPIVIGGAMVDLFRPSTMYEAGAAIDPANIIRPGLHNRSLGDPETLNDLAREVPYHFNGWWYCAIPAAMFREHGLPLPIFIRGDDMEYGARLFSRGVPTVSLPPVAVWHEPFYAKAPGWQLYYDLRNRLIFAACHPSLARLDRAAVILRRLIDSLLKHDYRHATLVIRAVEDFLAGPMVLNKPMDVLHLEISTLAASYALRDASSGVGMVAADWRPPPRSRAWRRLTLLAGLSALVAGWARTKPRPDRVLIDQWHPWMTMHVSQYGLSDHMRSYLQVYRYDRASLRDCLWRGLATVRRYRREAASAASQWHSAQDELASWPRWERILGLAPHTPAGRAGTEETQ